MAVQLETHGRLCFSRPRLRSLTSVVAAGVSRVRGWLKASRSDVESADGGDAVACDEQGKA
jgi:hypothetical protein